MCPFSNYLTPILGETFAMIGELRIIQERFAYFYWFSLCFVSYYFDTPYVLEFYSVSIRYCTTYFSTTLFSQGH